MILGFIPFALLSTIKVDNPENCKFFVYRYKNNLYYITIFTLKKGSHKINQISPDTFCYYTG